MFVTSQLTAQGSMAAWLVQLQEICAESAVPAAEAEDSAGKEWRWRVVLEPLRVPLLLPETESQIVVTVVW